MADDLGRFQHEDHLYNAPEHKRREPGARRFLFSQYGRQGNTSEINFIRLGEFDCGFLGSYGLFLNDLGQLIAIEMQPL